MKRLEKAILERDKALARVGTAGRRLEEEKRKLAEAEAVVVEAENMEYGRVARELHLSVAEFEALKAQLKEGKLITVHSGTEKEEGHEKDWEET